jgi:plastocyanin
VSDAPNPAPVSAESDDDELEGSAREVTKGLFLAALALLVVAGITVIIALSRDGASTDRRASQTMEYVIPKGTGAQVDLGNIPANVFPEYLEVQKGDTIVIRNEDGRNHILGPFSVRAGETFTYVFQQVGSYRGQCTVHGSGHEAVVRVLDAIAPAVV